MPKQIVGNVYWIENGKQTSKVVDVKEAFSDGDQARSQIQFAEASGDKKQLRLSRLAYRQYQGKRYRVENGKKPSKSKSSKRSAAGRNVGVRAAKKATKNKTRKK